MSGDEQRQAAPGPQCRRHGGDGRVVVLHVLEHVLAQDHVEAARTPPQSGRLGQGLARHAHPLVGFKALLEQGRQARLRLGQHELVHAVREQALAERADPGTRLGHATSRGVAELVEHPVAEAPRAGKLAKVEVAVDRGRVHARDRHVRRT